MKWPLITRWRAWALVGVTIVSGCSAPAGASGRRWLPSWLDSGRAHETGAETPPSPGGGTRGSARIRDDDRFESVQLLFDVLTIDMPSGGGHPSLNVWNHADALRLEGGAVARLAKNGIRAGVGSRDAWPAVEAIVDAADGVVRRERFSLDRASEMSIARGTVTSGESFFFYDVDNRLVGKTFDKGVKILNLDRIVLREIGGLVAFDLSFEIHHDPGGLSWIQTREGIQAVPATNRHVFESTGVSVELAPGEFMIVGPALESENEYLVGGRFFLADIDGIPRETIVCIAPRMIRTDVGR